ncbi:hypothetical protein RchiOBHm_Chr3g0453311 [Rosa chinensis]|uniref:Uncharacterized protein n=1 Tax=Rosa chinensis TaxID=74649 RepID=A0A2P6R6J3_ROSCH|nr:hypothetical protein RchiOBHm_Chr3g0453311 [Rosa chinensis]
MFRFEEKFPEMGNGRLVSISGFRPDFFRDLVAGAMLIMIHNFLQLDMAGGGRIEGEQ